MFVFYLDENLHGDKFANVLREAGVSLELCKEHGFSGADDTLWIPEVAKRGWVALTGDIKTRFRPHEKEVIIVSRARMIHVRKGKNATHEMLAINFVNSLAKVERFLERNEAPCLATLTRPSKVEDYLAGKSGNINPQDLSR